ncbi:endophilin-A isoform X2 [Phlebotomus papatasi]|uniref:endophilin-A isoform X2 n=1 Tax=Phlebotomus papatasi TaxID=29031 RepID=UPI002483E057|nr:endophilin-A isoform X2 [Phlebotomus papatasi]
MAFAGLKKQINKANQYVTEKMGGAEGTKLDLDFMDMERKTDVTVELVEELQAKTKEFLQPNPTARAKMAAVKGISKLSGQAKSNTYPQPEGLLADCMLLYGKKLGEDSIFAQALIEMGESLKQMADVKYSLDDNIKQNFLEPLHHLQTKDLKEVIHHRKKLQGRRLDYDCKRRRQAKDDEIRSAEEKFAESLHLAQMGMFNLLENDVEQVSQLVTFSEALLDYHQQCTEVLKCLVETLQCKREEAEARPKTEFVPKTLADLNIEGLSMDGLNGGRHLQNSHPELSSSSRNQNMYSSQQNLSTSRSAGGSAGGALGSDSNFSRSKMYGSQQSLSSKRQSQSNGQQNARSSSSFNSHNKNPYYVSGVADQWLNAWDLPTPPQPAPAARSTATRRNPTSRSITSSSNSSSVATHNSHFNNDPWSASPLPSPMRSPAKAPQPQRPSGPCCSALYDFEPENPGELGFKENDIIQLINRVDENWYEGSVNGRTGYFPQSYVQVMVPLPN